MKVYTVIREGVYMQGVYGLYEHILEAAAAAQQEAMRDSDNYHSWTVYELAVSDDDHDEWLGTEFTYRKSPTSMEIQYDIYS